MEVNENENEKAIEIAIPRVTLFISQVVIFSALALRVGRRCQL